MTKRAIDELIFAGADNTFTVEYTVDGSLYDFTSTTKVEFTLNGTSVDSVANATYFDYSTGTDGRIIFKLGAAGYVNADSGLATVKVFDVGNTNGVIFSSPVGHTYLDIQVI